MSRWTQMSPLALAIVLLIPAGLALSQPASQTSPKAAAPSRAVGKAASTGPVRNLPPQKGEEIVTIRYFKIKKGSFPEFLAASQNGVWPFFEKIGARIVGMWQVIPDPEGGGITIDYDEVYLMTRYASLEHWSATRRAAALGGDGPDFAALQAASAVRQSLTLESRVTYLKGVTGPLPPIFLPPTGERFVKVEAGAPAP